MSSNPKPNPKPKPNPNLNPDPTPNPDPDPNPNPNADPNPNQAFCSAPPLTEWAEHILAAMLLPNLVWRAGRVAEQVRLAVMLLTLTLPLTPTPTPTPNPDPNPDPHPLPHPNPIPHPNPHQVSGPISRTRGFCRRSSSSAAGLCAAPKDQQSEATDGSVRVLELKRTPLGLGGP